MPPMTENWRELCEACDGEGTDGDLLWPRRCERCDGTGWEPPSCAPYYDEADEADDRYQMELDERGRED
jgi:hypothetical protein